MMSFIEIVSVLAAIGTLSGGLIVTWVNLNKAIIHLATRLDSLEKTLIATNTKVEILEVKLNSTLLELNTHAAKAVSAIENIQNYMHEYRKDMTASVGKIQETVLHNREEIIKIQSKLNI